MDKKFNVISFSVDTEIHSKISDSAKKDAETVAAFCRRAVLARMGEIEL